MNQTILMVVYTTCNCFSIATAKFVCKENIMGSLGSENFLNCNCMYFGPHLVLFTLIWSLDPHIVLESNPILILWSSTSVDFRGSSQRRIFASRFRHGENQRLGRVFVQVSHWESSRIRNCRWISEVVWIQRHRHVPCQHSIERDLQRTSGGSSTMDWIRRERNTASCMFLGFPDFGNHAKVRFHSRGGNRLFRIRNPLFRQYMFSLLIGMIKKWRLDRQISWKRWAFWTIISWSIHIWLVVT